MDIHCPVGECKYGKIVEFYKSFLKASVRVWIKEIKIILDFQKSGNTIPLQRHLRKHINLNMREKVHPQVNNWVKDRKQR